MSWMFHTEDPVINVYTAQPVVSLILIPQAKALVWL
jgi:hypothetical protein